MSPLSLPNGRSLTSVSVVGRGRLGPVLARALVRAGMTVHGPSGRGEPIAPADVVLLCVPDREIPDAASAAAGHGAFLGHTSGATALDDVDFGLHPLQTFAGGPADLDGIGCAVGGRTAEALDVARGLAGLLGMRAFEIADGRRAAYHAAATFASNFLVTLEAAAERLFAAAAPTADGRALLVPLVRRTLENWAAQGPEAALTGPIARGDHETVARQRAAVESHAPELLPMFDVLADRTGALAGRNE
ncbi:DUF2520 domain-containing protein [Microbacterium sp. X-17]|uniref:DUF2520 domain-containing protein n=1 Tax=Microbacterium sp. X-17 TaxID=3144404 RepID=UPI0031F5D24E